MRRSLITMLLPFLLCAPPVFAQDEHEADRAALRGMLQDIEQGINNGNIDLMAKHIADNATVTWLNAETSKGPDGVRAYFRRMVGDAPGTILSKYSTHPMISGPAVFHGDVAVANGTTRDEFTPHHRSVFKFDSRWTATLRKSEGQWRIIALHLSTNNFDNELIDELKQFAIYSGIGGALAGLLLAAVLAYWRRRTK